MKHFKRLFAIILAGLFCTANATVCDQLLNYYTQQRSLMHVDNPQAHFLDGKACFVYELNKQANLDEFLRIEKSKLQGTGTPQPMTLVPQEYHYMEQLLGGTADYAALAWLDGRLFESMPHEEIVGVLPNPDPATQLANMMGNMHVE